MHSSTIFSSLLAVSGALAVPLTARYSNTTISSDQAVTVILQDQATELGSQTTFVSVLSRQVKTPVGSTGPFSTFELSVGSGAKQDLRCQALDPEGQAIIGVRGANTDITFSDADKGPWTFKQPSIVSQIVCDPLFVAVSPDAFDVTVILENQAIELGSQTVFEDFIDSAAAPPTASNGPFQTVEIEVGELVNPELRCKLLDLRGRPIIANRGENKDITFSDADKGPWTFEAPQKRVSKIICDEQFVANNLNV